MRTVRAGLVMAAVVALGLVPGPCDAHAPGARREGAISCEELRRQLTTQGGGIFSDAAATRGDRGAHWGSAYASTYIVAGVVYQTTSVRTGILYVYEPTSGQYRAAALFNNYDANRPLTGEEAAVYGRATRHLYPASGDAPSRVGAARGSARSPMPSSRWNWACASGRASPGSAVPPAGRAPSSSSSSRPPSSCGRSRPPSSPSFPCSRPRSPGTGRSRRPVRCSGATRREVPYDVPR